MAPRAIFPPAHHVYLRGCHPFLISTELMKKPRLLGLFSVRMTDI